jgi:Domain of unknown function (DUF4434)
MFHIERALSVLAFLMFVSSHSLAAPASTIDLSVSSARVRRGETVEIKIKNATDQIKAVLLVPSEGLKPLSLTRAPQSNDFHVKYVLPNDAREGLYVVHAWTGDVANPTAVGKATFLSGRLVNDFFIASYVDTAKPALDVEAYLKDFRSVGGNFLIAHNLITPTGALYASKIIHTDVTSESPNDIVELLLNQADKQGFGVLLSVSWDMTRQTPFKDRMVEIKAIARELFELYSHHPSLAGFYSYQEGSGTYFVPFVREFSQFIKTLNPNLLTACAPHTDDPLLAGYLSTVEELDIIIYQAGVMASYRPDNRKMYPFRRVKDFCGLGAGAKRLQNKISIDHVELFGYLENRLNSETTATTYENIYPQILSAATITNADGISFFTYHAHVYEASKKFPQVERSRAAVSDGVKAFELITDKVSQTPNDLQVYFPYSDWIIERWPNYFLPALDAFRVLGVPVDVLPYAPPLEESVYPYYPFHLNKDVLNRLLGERTVLVLPNVSGFQQTDGDLIKAFVEGGGVILAFGPQIPMSRSYERNQLFGIEETSASASHNAVTIKSAIGTRAKSASRVSVNAAPSALWKLKGARLIASFEDGSPAVTINKYGKGAAIAIIPDAWTAAQKMPQLTRDVLDYARSLRGGSSLVDIVGTNEKTDVAVEQTADGFRAAVVNHNRGELSVVFKPINLIERNNSTWIDLVNDKSIVATDDFLTLTLPAKGFRAIEYRKR